MIENENVMPDTHLTLACLLTMATKGNFQEHKKEIANIMQSVLDLDRVVRKERDVGKEQKE